ncbi:MAG: 3-keto-5-aminohexanoate cleavage protein, partial [Pseudomonadota bacterium]
MAKTQKTIITCAVTGSIHTPTMSEHLPVTQDEIARQSIE